MRNLKRSLALVALVLALVAAPAAAADLFEFYDPTFDSSAYCYMEDGYWTWDGQQFVLVPDSAVCWSE